jgi:RNA polymerase sigma factor (sigma-70 family)
LVTFQPYGNNKEKKQKHNEARHTMQLNNETIISGLLEKQPQVFDYLYQTYGPNIKGHVLKNKGNEEDAKEMVQLTMIKLWTAVREGRYQEEGKLGHYIFQIAANSWREELRRRRNQPNTQLDMHAFSLRDSTDEDIERAVVKDQYLNAIHEGITRMEGICKELIQQYHLKKVDLKSLAQQLDYNYNNLRKRIFDCRKKLKKMVEKILADKPY